MTYITRQEAFDKAYLGLAGQDFKLSIIVSSSGSNCAYRGEDGTRCAYGHLIPDEKYDPSFEGRSVCSLNYYDKNDPHIPTVEKLFAAANIDPEDVDFYNALQRCHDSCLQFENGKPYQTDDMRNRLIRFAQTRSLTVPELAND